MFIANGPDRTISEGAKLSISLPRMTNKRLRGYKHFAATRRCRPAALALLLACSFLLFVNGEMSDVWKAGRVEGQSVAAVLFGKMQADRF